MKTYIFGMKSSSLWLRQKNHCRCPQKSLSLIFFMKISLSGGWKSLSPIDGLLQTLNTRKVTDCPRVTLRVTEMRSISTRTQDVQFYRRVCINTAVELDRPWRWSFTHDKISDYVFRIRRLWLVFCRSHSDCDLNPKRKVFMETKNRVLLFLESPHLRHAHIIGDGNNCRVSTLVTNLNARSYGLSSCNAARDGNA